MASMEIERRAFLRGSAALALTLFGPLRAMAGSDGTPVYLSACQLADGRFAIASFDPEGAVLRTVPLPDRGHAVTLSPDRRIAIAFARHPRDFAVAFDVAGAREPVLFRAAEGRHFYGHGAFSADGRIVYATENDYDNARGVIGVYDAADGYRRLGEFDSGGVGPHELLLMPDGVTLAVANGGIETHPDTGDAKLNLPTMAPSLAFIGTRHGDIAAQHGLTDDLHQLSIRHMATDASGAIWFGCQYEGPAEDRPPLIGRAGAGAGLELMADPAPLRRSLDNYVGSVAASRDGSIIAASSPRGGRIVFWGSDGKLLGVQDLADGCGLAAMPADGRFIATSGHGDIVGMTATAETPVAKRDVSWDNHVAAILPAA